MEAGPADGRDDALRHSEVPAAARRPRRRDAAHRRDGRHGQARHQGRRHRADDEGRRLRRRVPRRRRAHRQAGVHPGQGFGAHPRRGRGAALDGRRGRRRCSAAASSSTAAATPRSTSPAPPSASARPRRSSSTGARARSMPAHDFEVEEALEEGVHGQVAVDHQAGGRRRADDREDGARREGQPAARPASSKRSQADSLVLALGQDVDLSLLDGVPGLKVRGRRRRGRSRRR